MIEERSAGYLVKTPEPKIHDVIKLFDLTVTVKPKKRSKNSTQKLEHSQAHRHHAVRCFAYEGNH